MFERYFTSEVWGLIGDETNRYAATCREPQGATRASRHRPWVDVTVEEIRAYIGVCILIGIVVLPKIDLYWSQKHDLRIQPISQALSRSLGICMFVTEQRRSPMASQGMTHCSNFANSLILSLLGCSLYTTPMTKCVSIKP